MSLLAMPTPSKSTDVMILVYCRDKKQTADSNVLYLKTKQKTPNCSQPRHKSSTHFCSLVDSAACSRQMGSSRQMFRPNIYNFMDLALDVKCGCNLGLSLLWIHRHGYKMSTGSKHVCVGIIKRP